MRPFVRRRRGALAVVIACLAALCAASGARAEDPYPNRPITMIVPFAAGGPTDILGRVIAQAISPMLGQQVVIEDVTGAGGTIGATKAARAAPDGYTMVMGNLGTHAASVGIYKDLPYDPRTDFVPVILVASTPMVLVTRKTLPLHTLDEVIAWAKANKGKATMGSAGVGSISHLTLLLFNHLTGAGVTHVPYRGLSEAINDLLGGQIDLLFDQVVTATPHIAADQENAIVVTIPQRAPAIPKVPSANEAGLPALQTVAWTALFLPKGTPAAVVTRINAAVQKAMGDPAMQKRLSEIGADIPPPNERSPEALGNLVKAEIDKWVPLIKAAGVVAQ
ncbi:MAG TPA: tripartite tricarboxylate transporter substrate-binding protein [Xanthobacteraceae bacterium]|nr:tripartite tricarboxylate transporter substrate-binding protein [Xanthobacteraceae bacterium]